MRRRLVIAAAGAVALAATAGLIAGGVLWPNRVPAAAYAVRGVDVSAYQGAIDWPVLAAEDLDFAVIKATEGRGFVDERFADNWADARATSLAVGAYHFVTFEASAEEQLANVIATVPVVEGALPITVDLEFYGEHFASPPDAELVRGIVDPLLAGLEQHYGAPPILYTTAEAYERYVRDRYPANPIWIRDVALPPTLPDDRDWTIWQYSHRDRLPGYDGVEPFIDMNVLAGGPARLQELLGE